MAELNARMTVAEYQAWAEFFRLEQQEQEKAMRKAKAGRKKR